MSKARPRIPPESPSQPGGPRVDSAGRCRRCGEVACFQALPLSSEYHHMLHEISDLRAEVARLKGDHIGLVAENRRLRESAIIDTPD